MGRSSSADLSLRSTTSSPTPPIRTGTARRSSYRVPTSSLDGLQAPSSSPSPSYDGSRVFAATIRPDGTDYTELPIDDPTLNVGCMLWSPDGTRLACEGWDDTDPTRNGIYTINASDGGGLQRVTSSPGGNHDLPGSYAPDGRLVFARIAPDRDNGHLMVVDPDGGEPEQLTEGTYGIPRISPDGETILADHDGVLHLIPLDGGPRRRSNWMASRSVAAGRRTEHGSCSAWRLLAARPTSIVSGRTEATCSRSRAIQLRKSSRTGLPDHVPDPHPPIQRQYLNPP